LKAARLLTLMLLLSCGPKPPPAAPETDVSATLAMARARPAPERAQARFTIKLRSKPLELAGTTGGGLVVDRPGRLHIEIFGPLGSSLLKVTSDGEALGVLLPKEERQLLAPSADEALREMSGGTLSLDDLAGVLLGDLPFDVAEVKGSRVLEDGTHQLDLEAQGVSVQADLDPTTGTPRHLLATDGDGVMMVEATYGVFTEIDGLLWPSEVEIFLPAVDLTTSLRFKGWKAIDEVPPVFDLTPPEGFVTEDLQEALKDLKPLED
jgi:hypothetical protein